MTYTLNIVIRIVIATVLAVVFGNGSVVAFNHFPQKWFEDRGDDGAGNEIRTLPPKLLEADNCGRQRITSTPWKYVFTGLFLVTGIYLSMTAGIQYEIGTLLVLAIILEMAIADELYRTVPDQLQMLLVVSALGFVTFNENWWEPLAGAGIGLALGLGVFGLGLLIFHTGSIGGADIKFFTGVGFIVGRKGAVVIFVLTTLFFAIESAYRIATHRSTLKDSNAMLPAGFVATLVYMLFLYNMLDMIQL